MLLNKLKDIEKVRDRLFFFFIWLAGLKHNDIFLMDSSLQQIDSYFI